MEKKKPSSAPTALLDVFGKLLQLQGRPACRNKKCENFLTYAPDQIRKFGTRPNKSMGKIIQRYECLVCKQKFTDEPIDFSSPSGMKNKHIFKKLRYELDEAISYEKIAEKNQVSVKTIFEMMEPLTAKVGGQMMGQEIFFDGEIVFLEIPIRTNEKFQATTFFGFRGSAIETNFTTKDTEKGRHFFVSHYLHKFKALGKELKIQSPYHYDGTVPIQLGDIPDESKIVGFIDEQAYCYMNRILLLEPTALDSVVEKAQKIKTAINKIKDKKEKQLSNVSIYNLKKAAVIPSPILKALRKDKQLSPQHIESILNTVRIPRKHLDEIQKVMPLSPAIIERVTKAVIKHPAYVKVLGRNRHSTDTYEYFLKACHDLKFLKWTKAKNIQELRERLLLFSMVYTNRKRKHDEIAGQKLRALLNRKKSKGGSDEHT